MPLLLLLLLPVVWEAPLAQRLELRQNVTVQEGLCVFVPCRFSLPWVSFGKFYMFWFRERADTKRDPPVATNKPEQKLREGTQGRFSVPGEPQAGNCSLSITDVNAGDSGTYFFQVETHFRKYAYLNKMLFLNVIDAPQHVAISIFQGNRTALKILQNTSSLPVQEGQALQLLCVADSNPPAQLSWFRGSPALEATPISSTGVLELPCVGAAEEGEFTCRAQNPLGSQNISLSLSVVCKRQPWAGKVLGAVGGAGITVLLSLCLYLIFRVKTHRKTQPVQSMDDTNQAGGSGSRERQPQFWTDTPADHPAPAGAGPISRNEQELHYAFLQFHKPKPQKQESTHTEYSEIKIHK